MGKSTGGNEVRTLTWEVKEGFYFPQSLGLPSELTSVKVTPQWTEEHSADSIRLHGIYHVAANIQFQPGEVSEFSNADYAFIEDLDMQDDVGYFEYAIPLHVDLPLDKVQYETNPQLAVKGLKSEFREDGSCLLKWDATCSFEEREDEQFKVLESSSSSSSIMFSSKESGVVQAQERPVVSEAQAISEAKAQAEAKAMAQAKATTESNATPEANNLEEPVVAEAETDLEDQTSFYVYDLKDDYSVSAYRSNSIAVEKVNEQS